MFVIRTNKKNMKKFKLLLVGVLFCTLAFANGTVEPNESSSTMAITNSNGSSVFKLFYKGEQAGLVKVSIVDEADKIVFTESIKNKRGFVRPYNFNKLGMGAYTMVIEDNQGRQTKEIIYAATKIEKFVNLIKINEHGKYLLMVKSESSDQISINIFDESNKLIHSHDKIVNKDFAEVLNIKDINQFTIEVSDSNGVLKSLKN